MKFKDISILINSGKCCLEIRNWGKQDWNRFDVTKTYKKHLTTTSGKIFYKDIAEYRIITDKEEQNGLILQRLF